MKRYIRTSITANPAQQMLGELNARRIGHAGYPETYGECRVQNRDGKWVKGKFTSGHKTPDGNVIFRVRIPDDSGSYTESNYVSDDIEFM